MQNHQKAAYPTADHRFFAAGARHPVFGYPLRLRRNTEHHHWHPADTEWHSTDHWHDRQPGAKHLADDRRHSIGPGLPDYRLRVHHQPNGRYSGAGGLSRRTIFTLGGITRLVAGYTRRGLPSNWLLFVIGVLDLIIAWMLVGSGPIASVTLVTTIVVIGMLISSFGLFQAANTYLNVVDSILKT